MGLQVEQHRATFSTHQRRRGRHPRLTTSAGMASGNPECELADDLRT